MIIVKEDTQAKLKFEELHKDLLNLEMYDFADRLADVFCTNSQEKYEAGLNKAAEIYGKYSN